MLKKHFTTTMTKRILIPTDFSSQAKAALMSAMKMAEKMEATLFVLHSVDIHDRFIPRSSPESTESREAILVKRLEKQMEEHLKSEGLESLKPTTIIGTNSILEDVMEACETHKIDFIVMGSSGTSFLEGLFIGSNTERVVRHSKVPVVVIKDKPIEFEKGSSFVFASSLKNKDKSALEKAKAVAESLQTNLELLYINTEANHKNTKEIFSLITSFLTEEERLDIKVIVHDDSTIEKGILNYMDKRKDVVYGIGTNGRKGLARFFNDSIAENLVNAAPSSIICFKID